jgi:4-deoxy-L-threo-5-hexosulose-uronate ketol-isomerase
MEIRYTVSPKETAAMDTAQLRANFLMENVMVADEINFVYSHFDRFIVGGAVPVQTSLQLGNYDALKADYFLERREMGIINVGGKGIIMADGIDYELDKLDCLYLGKGTKEVFLMSVNPENPANFYITSAPAHNEYPNTLLPKEQASPMSIGAQENANHRTIYKYIHADGIKSCQLVMGLTTLHSGSVWNTMPAHTHDRRMEAYFYFDVPPNQVVFHLMGQPQETRHIVVQNHQAVISAPWSVHAGCGTANYGFIWAMAGENFVYTDMDMVTITDLR